MSLIKPELEYHHTYGKKETFARFTFLLIQLSYRNIRCIVIFHRLYLHIATTGNTKQTTLREQKQDDN
jgi:hypothetical protein